MSKKLEGSTYGKPIDCGTRYGNLVVIALSHKANGHSYYACRCDCGNEASVRKDALLKGTQVSCGCIGRAAAGRRSRKHGMAGKAPEYAVWQAMLRRCDTPTNAQFKNYGGRGVTVCERWRTSFENFLADMGERPSNLHSLDRVDTNANYEPGNCRWATMRVQANNRRNNRFVEYKGTTRTIGEWEREMGFPPNLLRDRLKRGWPIEDAMTLELQPRGKSALEGR